jgi:hypothetical protein
LVSRGVTRTGDVYCMSCGEYVEAGASQCPVCDSILDDEVKAFRCPRCERINEFGIPECSGCGMRFKVKSLKTEGPSEEMIVSELLGEEAMGQELGEEPAENAVESDGRSVVDLEDQVAKREELVDRKIKGYAAKMKDLLLREQDLEARNAEFDRRAEEAADTPEVATVEATVTTDPGESARLVEQVNAAARRIQSLLAKITDSPPEEPGEMGFERLLDALEEAFGHVLEDRARLEGRLREDAESEDDLRRLMRALDQLLEKLPEEAVTEFANTAEYKLYEHVLDRLKL